MGEMPTIPPFTQEMKVEECQRCKDIDYDRRTLEMACFYDMNELNVPFKLDEATLVYSLRVCKDCRSEWMKAIQSWFNNVEQEPKSPGSGIFVREFGANVEISDEEWNKRHPGVEPCRFRGVEIE